ncbi:MAG TPA: MATE family efflux transporter [Bacteroidales bacterium]|nr:MATE family efflux transporter [Bacteroidales bacterium]HOR81972.1 MATE family efflux transporter [Bacteroidales bacterium]HPJ91495.1 MATE family efflux transporter [Bacteroidales bacterium]
MPTENNKRIAKNTGMLYFRMLITMLVSLYTSRIILNELGVDDFGIYNVVGGVIMFFLFLSNALSAALQRFLSFALGQNNQEQLKKIFVSGIIVQLFIIVIVLLLAETVGLWFVNHKLIIPIDRMYAANCVYQFTILTFIINLLVVPYNACLIAYEKMSFYAYISIAESVLRLAMAFLLQFVLLDKLIVYAGLISAICLIILFLYIIYCRRTFSICRFSFIWDSQLLKKIMSFSGWSLLGSFSDIAVVQGVNLILNMFFGVIVNAAMGIAHQVNAALNSFVLNFQTAFKPQLIKIFAAGEKHSLHSLIIQTSKISFLLLLVLALPILLNTSLLLEWWLKNVPDYTVEFCQLVIVSSLINSMSGSLWVTAQATGKIKTYQIVISFILLSNLVISYFMLKNGFNAASVLWLRIIISVIALIARLFFIRKLVGLSFYQFMDKVVFRILLTCIVALPLPLLAHYYMHGWLALAATTILSFLCISISAYFIVLQSDEKAFVNKVLLKFIKKS